MNFGLNDIDYEWVKSTNEKSKLKHALKLLQNDGGYFPDLERTIKIKLYGEEYDKISDKLKSEAADELHNWEQNMNRIDKDLNTNQSSIKLNEIEKKKQAEALKIKGNDLMKTKSYQLAIEKYTESIENDENESTTYFNRAQAYFKICEYKKSLEDCEFALKITSSYTKARFRKACCLFELKEYEKAGLELESLLVNLPENEEIRNKYTEVSRFISKKEEKKEESKFKKIKIIEENNDVKSIKENKKEISNNNNTIINTKENENKLNSTLNKEEQKDKVKPEEKSIKLPNSQSENIIKKSKVIEINTDKVNQAINIARNNNDFDFYKKNSSGFEQAIASFKSSPLKFFDFMEYFTAEIFNKAYEKIDLSLENFVFILNCIKENRNRIIPEDSSQLINEVKEEFHKKYVLCKDYLSSLLKSKNFALKKLMLKNKKKDFSFLYEILHEDDWKILDMIFK